jgi:hypothetical protein
MRNRAETSESCDKNEPIDYGGAPRHITAVKV